MAIGVFPAYIIADLHDMGIRQNIKKIGVSLLKHAMAAFRTNIWILRCTLNAERENDLVSQLEINELTPSTTITTHLDRHKHTRPTSIPLESMEKKLEDGPC